MLEKIEPILEKWLDPKHPDPINAFTSCWLCNLMAVLESRGSPEVGPGWRECGTGSMSWKNTPILRSLSSIFVFRHHEGGSVLKHMRRASQCESCAPMCTHLCVSSQRTHSYTWCVQMLVQDGLCACMYASTKHTESTPPLWYTA